MKRKESVIGGLDRILSAHQASALLGIPADDLLPYYSAQEAISLRNLFKRICRSNPIYHFPIIGKRPTPSRELCRLSGKVVVGPWSFWQGIMSATGASESITCIPSQMSILPGRRNLPYGQNGFLSCRCPVSMGWIFRK